MLWIVGTSVSIESGGYATRLAQRLADESGIKSTNLSIGDQSSVMGCMRVLEYATRIRPGDVVIWEYSMLDTLLVPSAFSRDEVEHARRTAWQIVRQRKACLIILMTPPKKYVAKPSVIETRIAAEAKYLAVPCIDGRDLLADCGPRDLRAQYRDDRHPFVDAPIIDAMVDRMFAEVASRHGVMPTDMRQVPGTIDTPWRWVAASELASFSQAALVKHRNALMSIDAVLLSGGDAIKVPRLGRIVAVGIVSTHESGGLWCGHEECSPVSSRLPENLKHSFLLRSTRMACVQGDSPRILAAPASACHKGVWAAYGQELSYESGPVNVFGLLLEPGKTATASLVDGLRWWPRNRVARALRPFARIWRRVASIWRANLS